MSSGSLEAYWAIRFDRLTAIMLIVVTTFLHWCIYIVSATWIMIPTGSMMKVINAFLCIFIVLYICNANVSDF